MHVCVMHEVWDFVRKCVSFHYLHDRGTCGWRQAFGLLPEGSFHRHGTSYYEKLLQQNMQHQRVLVVQNAGEVNDCGFLYSNLRRFYRAVKHLHSSCLW